MNYMETKGVIEELSKRLDRKSTDVSSLIDGFVSIIKEKCGNLDSIAIPGFGNFIPVKNVDEVLNIALCREEKISVLHSAGDGIYITPEVCKNILSIGESI